MIQNIASCKKEFVSYNTKFCSYDLDLESHIYNTKYWKYCTPLSAKVMYCSNLALFKYEQLRSRKEQLSTVGAQGLLLIVDEGRLCRDRVGPHYGSSD